MNRATESDIDRLYRIFADLDDRIGKRRLEHCNGRMSWPARGVYFFFERGEVRRDGTTPRVVRVGTHAVSAGSKNTLWKRLASHRGTNHGGGNHRGSIFRLWVGKALLEREARLIPKPITWGQGSSAPRDVRDAETHVEQAVSACIASMPFLWIEADDEPGRNSIRRVIESGAIALLSGCGGSATETDPPSDEWLGRHCPKEAIRRSGLWNVRDVEGSYDPIFLDVLEKCARETPTR